RFHCFVHSHGLFLRGRFSSSPTDSAHFVYSKMNEDRILERCLVRIDVAPRLIRRCAVWKRLRAA
ncbi:MAG: hypothetical protein LBT81_05345, partial [Helicobacteraceae bacterium]|nr:hypothetical protein [Helicobacteraceae bacterium]